MRDRRITKTLLGGLALALFAAVLPASLYAQDFPKLDGRVTDAAGILSDDVEARLTQKLEALETQSQRQVVVATIPDLQGYNIADYGYRLGREWGIGDAERNDGALLIVAPNERKVRIEVGYGLEPVLTDGLSHLIINEQIVPRFRKGDMAGGIEAGTDAIVTQLTLPPDEAQRLAAEADTRQQDTGNGFTPGIFFMLFFLFFFVIPLLRGIFGRKGAHRYRGSRSSPIIWAPGGFAGGRSGGFRGGFSGGFSGGGGSFGGGGASGGW